MPNQQETLAVYLGERRIGTLLKTRKGARFAYDEAVVARHEGQPILSAALPVKRRPYSEGLTGNWFSGLLPEGPRLDRLCRELGCGAWDYFEILKSTGWECAGAVRIVPDDADDAAPSEELIALSVDDLAKMLSDLPSFEAWKDGYRRLSLGGFQEKLCIVARNLKVEGGRIAAGELFLPNAAAPSTHILKPQPPGKYGEMAEAEAWAMKTASCAARCAKVELLKGHGMPTTLVVERFDRAVVGEVARIHQEDCCQALGLSPEGKYAETQERGTDPTYGKIAGLLTRYSSAPDAEQAELLRQMTANLALGNLDAHAKNYSFMYATAAVPALSPLYDVVPVSQVEPAARHLSMRVNGKLDFAEVTKRDCVLEAVGWGMAEDVAEKTVARCLDDVCRGVAEADEAYPDLNGRYAEAVLQRVEALG